MAVSLRVLVPEDTTNYIQNPQFRLATTDWNAVGSTLSRTMDMARFGIASLKVITTGAALNEGTYYRVKDLSGISDWVTVSVYVRGTGKVRIRLKDVWKGSEFRGEAVALDGERWERLSVTGRCSGSDDVRLYVETADTSAKAITFYVDGAQMERKPYATSYCDGYQTGCRWNLVENSSLSTRLPDVRWGGRWVDLAGPCRPNNDIYVTTIGGLGMPPITPGIQPFSNAPGSFVQGYKVDNRLIIFSFHVKDEDLRQSGPPDLTALHALRQQLLDLVKPDRSVSGQPLWEYSENGISLYFRAQYDGGLDGEWDVRNKWVNSFPLRLLATRPMLYEDNQEVSQLDFSETFTPVGGKFCLIGRQYDFWNRLSSTVTGIGPNNNVKCFTFGKNGELYVGGDFTLCDGVAGTAYIAMWDGKKWNALGSGMNGAVNAMTIDANGNLWATGAFTTAGGSASNRMARWNVATSTWTAFATGLNGTGYAICVAPNGVVYIGGDFTTAGGITVNRITRYDGTIFQKVGTGTPGLNAIVYAIVNSTDGITLYVGGAFGSGPGQCITQLNTTTNLFSALEGDAELIGTGSTVYALAVDRDGTLYIGGSLVNTTPAKAVVKWNGGGRINIENDCNGIVYALSVDYRGYLYAGGSFTLVGGVNSRYWAYYGEGKWHNADCVINSPGTAEVRAIGIDRGPLDVYIGFSTTTQSNTYAPGRTIINNPGTSFSYPMFYIKGPGYLLYIENRTSRQRMFFNLNILSGEEITIDTMNAIVTSSFRKTVMYGVFPVSALGQFLLLPGENEIHALLYNDVGAIMQLSFTPQHWSLDAIGRPDSL